MIPKGEYGGGTMIVWDQGRWLPQGDVHKGYAKGHLEFVLEGERLNGRWHLVRMRPRPREKKEQWLLLKSEDEFARKAGDLEITEKELTSVLSGRTEEPSPQFQLAGLRRLCDRSPIPIAVGERVYSPSQFQLIAELGAAHVFEPDASICGGISACMDIAAIARAHDLMIVPHVGSPTAVGLAANLHWAAAAGCPLIEYDIYPELPMRDELLQDPILSMDRIENGMIKVPDGPGLGIELNESAFERFPYVSGETYAEVFPDHEAGRLRQIR